MRRSDAVTEYYEATCNLREPFALLLRRIFLIARLTFSARARNKHYSSAGDSEKIGSLARRGKSREANGEQPRFPSAIVR